MPNGSQLTCRCSFSDCLANGTECN
jgi:hypothetical protein